MHSLRAGAGMPGRRSTCRLRSGTRCGWIGARWLVPVDLPVDGVVVLEQEERAGQIQRAERPLGKW